MNREIIKNAIINAGITVLYIVLVASFLTRAETIFEESVPKDTVLIPIIMLLIFVVSAAITGFTVVGKPLMWYLDGKKKEALSLLGSTIFFLALIALFFISILL